MSQSNDCARERGPSRSGATVRDVARLAHTSVATVSHALNGTRPVNDQMRERVTAAAAQLGYKRNSIARSLRLGRSPLLGFVVSDIENPFFARLASHVQEAALQSGYQVVFANSDEDAIREGEVLRAMTAQSLAGIILAPVERANVERLALGPTPFILVNRTFDRPRVPHVVADDFEGGRLGIEHLWALGHRRIGVVRSDQGTSTGRARLSGAKAALAAFQTPLPRALIADAGRPDQDDGGAVPFLMRLASPPTAIFALDNWSSVSAIRGLGSARVRCPEELSLVGYGVTSPYWMATASVTMIVQPVEAIASAALTLILNLVEGREGCREVVLPPRLVKGRSTRIVDERAPRSLSRRTAV